MERWVRAWQRKNLHQGCAGPPPATTRGRQMDIRKATPHGWHVARFESQQGAQ